MKNLITILTITFLVFSINAQEIISSQRTDIHYNKKTNSALLELEVENSNIILNISGTK